ncbi:dihydrodipicolinate synthase family protein [Actinoallomurus acaciae]|uniref:Dihydrodipicolinate synthase family protein n=1 Tax=Actinoallomurus acaciae TaxID=502577 RepID=A0ABV5YBC3_9ACTN
MKPWQGIVVAAALPLRDDLSIDYDRFQEHVAWLAANGCDGVSPNGSLGEYQVLTPQERDDVVRAAVEAAPEGFSVVPGTGAYGAAEARVWAERALEAGADGVLSLPPNAYRAGEDEVVAHYRELAEVGLPVVSYNNPYDTNVDLTPELIARIAEFDNVVAVKEFSADVRRIHQIKNLAPRIDVLAGADDVVFELVLMGAVGWIGGFSNALPRECRRLYDLAAAGNVEEGLPLYRRVHDAFAWDSRHTFVQAIKLAMDMAGRYGGPVRLPRLPLEPDQVARARKDFEAAFAALAGV